MGKIALLPTGVLPIWTPAGIVRLMLYRYEKIGGFGSANAVAAMEARMSDRASILNSCEISLSLVYCNLDTQRVRI